MHCECDPFCSKNKRGALRVAIRSEIRRGRGARRKYSLKRFNLALWCTLFIALYSSWLGRRVIGLIEAALSVE